ncbi:hypothetical protein [Mucilaginibacter sp.]|uniref:hypothetical protein n=1 Tax=Mucilaginibacter sp. TaxID=1882438 RepID=UPI0035BBBD7F
MKKILLLMAFCVATSAVLAQQIKTSAADSLIKKSFSNKIDTNLFENKIFSQIGSQAGNFKLNHLNSFQGNVLASAGNTITFSKVDHMPILKTEGKSQMPVSTPLGKSQMPVLGKPAADSPVIVKP